jgi:uncharacterized protein (TIGR02284 family)
MDNPQIVATLNHLIQQGKDGELALLACAGHARNDTLRQMLQRRSDHARWSTMELQEIVRDFGGQPRSTGRLGGRLRRLAFSLRGVLLGWSDSALLDQCERVQAQAMGHYRRALDAPLPPTVRKVVLRQFEGIQRHQAVARSMRDSDRVMQQA